MAPPAQLVFLAQLLEWPFSSGSVCTLHLIHPSVPVVRTGKVSERSSTGRGSGAQDSRPVSHLPEMLPKLGACLLAFSKCHCTLQSGKRLVVRSLPIRTVSGTGIRILPFPGSLGPSRSTSARRALPLSRASFLPGFCRPGLQLGAEVGRALFSSGSTR